ncbi:MAG: hypothetical protein FJ291_00160 [Planctomycetes bacterium]|nr:hypothetical protein [Planctomycetota bacterium]
MGEYPPPGTGFEPLAERRGGRTPRPQDPRRLRLALQPLRPTQLDRFLHHADIIEITGRSHRLKDKARRNEKDTCREPKELV